jgi:nitrite reductase/ring-hydroxylating ferredoxin subunit
MQRRFACQIDELPKGSSMTIPAAEPIAVYRTDDGEFYATSDVCTHEQWSLGTDSDLEGTEVLCPLHMARFDIVTGKPLCFPATVALRTYPVETDGDAVYVLI